MAVEGRWQVRRMRAAVHVDRAIGVRSADVEDVDALEFTQLDDLHSVWREELARDAGWFAARVRLELVVLAILEERLGPRLERRVLQSQWIRDDRARKPDALFLRSCTAEQHVTIGAARRRLRRACLTSA